MAKERQAWPYMESMRQILKSNTTVTLENVTVLVDSVKVKVTHIQTKNILKVITVVIGKIFWRTSTERKKED
jgi:hypothetical protein